MNQYAGFSGSSYNANQPGSVLPLANAEGANAEGASRAESVNESVKAREAEQARIRAERVQAQFQQYQLQARQRVEAARQQVVQEQQRLEAGRLQAAAELAQLQQQLDYEYATAEYSLTQAQTRVNNPYVPVTGPPQFVQVPASTIGQPTSAQARQTVGQQYGGRAMVRLVPPVVR